MLHMFRAAHRSKHVEHSINLGIINSITKLHLVGISTESSMMHGSMNIKSLHVVWKVPGGSTLISVSGLENFCTVFTNSCTVINNNRSRQIGCSCSCAACTTSISRRHLDHRQLQHVISVRRCQYF